MVSRRAVAWSTFVFVLVALPAFARQANVFTPALRRALEQAPVNGKITLTDVFLREETLDTIEIEPMQVWAKDAKITVYDGHGGERIIPVPAIKYFKGRVVGEDESAVFFSKSEDGSIRGMVLIGERRWTIGSGVRTRPVEKNREGLRDDFAPILMVESDVIDDYDEASLDWQCQIANAPHTARFIEKTREGGRLTPVPNAGNVAGATYQLRIAIETDGEFCTAFSDNTTNINTYLGDLIGKASTVYSRDLKTTLVLGDVHLRTGGAGADPWTATGSASAALAEMGLYWHNNYSLGYPDPDGGGPGTPGGGVAVARSSAVFISGKLLSSGIAWLDFLCGDDFFCGTTGGSCGSATYANSYAGAYAFNGSSGSVTTTVPDPTATVNGVQYGLPNTSNFWMLLETLHELGHNVGGPHTQCMQLTAQEKIDFGVTRDWVDECYNLDGAGCFSGSMSGGQACSGGYCPGGVPTEKGTIMSYCHNISSGGFRQSRYLFGKAGETSSKVLTSFSTVLEAATPNPTITAQTEPVACSAGRTANVATCSGCTYAWQISGGTITSSTTTSSITYTPSNSSVILTVTVITARGCGITASKTVSTQCITVLPPTNVVATASSTTIVGVSWTAAAGASSYNVYRSTNGSTYTLAGNTATTSFNDTGRTANTAYLYKVRSVNGGESADSSIDLATTTIFTDDPLVAATTTIKAVHITELRTAINAVRTLASLGGGSYTDPTVTANVTIVKVLHVTDLRTAIDAARSALSLPALSYGDSITTSTIVKASHLTELRNGVK